MSTLKIGRNHRARKALFTRGIRRGFLTVAEIDHALPSGALTDAERWLLYYSLHAARVEVRDVRGRPVDVESLRPAGAADDALPASFQDGADGEWTDDSADAEASAAGRETSDDASDDASEDAWEGEEAPSEH